MSENWKLSPSDLTFLWDECKRCFYLKVRENFRRPSAPFPKVFSTIDLLMKDTYQDQSTSRISPELPEGRIIMAGRWVTSAPFRFENHRNTCHISGIFDTVVQFEDGSYGVIDFKTTKPTRSQVPFYSRQLHAYAYALEHPAPDKLGLQPVSKLGLLCFDPTFMTENPQGQLNLSGPATWVDCPLDMNGFLTFMEEVLDLLESDACPDPGPECGFCVYRAAARDTGY